VGVRAKGLVSADVRGVAVAPPPASPGKPKAPPPLPANDLDIGRPFRDRDKLVPYEQTGCQHGPDAQRSHYGQPPLELFVFRIVHRPSSRLVTEAEYAIGHEQDDGGENDPAYPECEIDCAVDVAPI